MLLLSACTGSLLECAKRVAGLKVIPVPRLLNGRLAAWLNCSGAVRLTVPPATDATVTFSAFAPMSSLMVSPGVMLPVELAWMLVAPAGAAAVSLACVPALPTAVIVTVSNVPP
jgi:hypothetical protein